QVDTGLEATQLAVLHQVQAELPEAEPGPVIPDARPEEISEPDIGEARPIAVAMLQAGVRHPADHEEEQIILGNHGRRPYRGEDVHGGAALGVRHQRQIDEILDRPTPDLAPEALVSVPALLLRGAHRSVDTDPPEIRETGLDGPVVPAEGREDLHLQP